MQKIMIIEDDQFIRDELALLLENEGYLAVPVTDYTDVIKQIRVHKPDLVLLDLGLPGRDGLALCAQIRKSSTLPVIIVTSRDSSADEFRGLSLGSDDYITKPYQPPLLLARIAAVLKRTQGMASREITLFTRNDVSLDIAKCCLSRKEQNVDLTKNEMKILHLLFQHPGTFVSRMDLIEYLWENRIFIDDNTLSVHVAKLREKLKSIGVEDFIETKRGMGYRI